MITSSMLTGVATMASNVPWFSMRKKEPQPHSAAADHIGQTTSRPGAMKSTYSRLSLSSTRPPRPMPNATSVIRGSTTGQMISDFHRRR
ncbi:MAG: hypothetical protein IIA91_00840 [Chloroflexi bacterium]|nr:hypothetical protein [Chloroflexota bacterium]